MGRRIGILGGVLAIALALIGAGMVATASSDVGTSGKKSSKFKPKQFAGKWKGSWKNTTFNSKGPATMKLTSKGKKFIGVFDIGGNAFGCPDPDERKRVMKKGKGPNTWNKKGFNVKFDNGHGPVKLSYKHKKGKFSGSGTSPCGPEITYAFDGKMTKKKVNAETEIFLEGDPFAESTLSMKKR